MQWIHALAPAVVAGCTAVASLSAVAQSAPVGGVRQKVDVRAMAPGLQASDANAAAEARPAASGLTREQRKEATLQARQDGVLQPAGEAADQRVDKPAASADAMRTPPATPEPEPPPDIGAEAASPSRVAAAEPPAAKKSARKKARAAAASAPV